MAMLNNQRVIATHESWLEVDYTIYIDYIVVPPVKADKEQELLIDVVLRLSTGWSNEFQGWVNLWKCANWW